MKNCSHCQSRINNEKKNKFDDNAFDDEQLCEKYNPVEMAVGLKILPKMNKKK